MKATCLLVVLLVLRAGCQAIVSPNSTLGQALLGNSSLDPDHSRALLATFQTHPELENYTVVAILVTPNASNDTTDYAVTLAGKDRLVEALVSITSARQAFLVNFKTIFSNSTPTQQNLTAPAHPPAGYSASPPPDNKSIILQAISYNGGGRGPTFLSGRTPRITYAPSSPYLPSSYKPAPALGSFLPFTNLDDARFWQALQFLATLHPHLLNYQVADVQYQLSFGVTFLIRYSGLDKMTGVVARVNIDLKLQPTLLGFSVACVAGELCVGEVGEQLFYGVEGLIKAHPELLDYSLISLDIEEAAGETVVAMVGFQQPSMRLRVLSDLKMEGKKHTILSFYSYLYE